jgi:PmbA protein
MMNRKNVYQNKLKWVEKKALDLGADAIRSVLNVSSQFTISQRDDSIEKMTEAIESSLRIEIYKDERYSYHSTNDLNEERLESFLDKAIAMTDYLQKDEYRKLPNPKWYARDLDKAKLELVDPNLGALSLENKKEVLERLVSSAYKKNNKLISVTGEFWNGDTLTVRRTSNGFSGSSEKTFVGMSVEVSLDEPGGRKPEDWKYINARHFSDLWAPEKVSSEAVKRVEAKVGAKKIASGKRTMIVENTAIARCLYPIIRALNGRSLSQKRSFLQDMKGENIGSSLFTLIDNPFIPRGAGSRLFDPEGLKAVKRPLFENGILKDYLINSYYGYKLGMDPNSGSLSNLVMPPGRKSPDELIKEINNGIYVTQFIGGNSNETTGDFSYGIMGHEIKNGKLIRPVTEMNISGNYLDLMKSLSAVGNDPNEFSSFRIPTLVFDNTDFAGK